MDLLHAHHLDAEVVDHPLGGGRHDVGHGDPAPVLHQLADEGVPDLPDAGHRHVAALEVGVPPQGHGDGFQPVVQALGGGHAGVAGTAQRLRHAGHEPGLAADEVHVGLGGADVLGGDVAAPEGVDIAGEGP